jgi:hypothetical protein
MILTEFLTFFLTKKGVAFRTNLYEPYPKLCVKLRPTEKGKGVLEQMRLFVPTISCSMVAKALSMLPREGRETKHWNKPSVRVPINFVILFAIVSPSSGGPASDIGTLLLAYRVPI